MNYQCECHKKLPYLSFSCGSQPEELVEEVREEDEEYSYRQPEGAVLLPGVLRIRDNVKEFSKVVSTDLPTLFQEMSQVISGLDDYQTNEYSFWLIDIFLEALREAQIAGMGHKNQKTTLKWVAYLYNVLQGSNSKLLRQDIFKNVKIYLFVISDEDDDEEEKFIENNENYEENVKPNVSSRAKVDKMDDFFWEIPDPPVWRTMENVQDSQSPPMKREDSDFEGESADSIENKFSKKSYTDAVIDTSKQNLVHMEVILEILYRIFGNLWTFTQVKQLIHSMPSINNVDLPFKLNVPKPLLKLDLPSSTKVEKILKKGISQRPSEEYQTDREATKNDYILPLQAAEGVDAFLKNMFSYTSQESIATEREKLKTDRKKK